MQTRTVFSIRAILSIAALLCACSGDVVDPKADVHVGFDLRALTNHSALGDAASTLASITLGVGLPGVDGDISTQTVQIAPTDSIVLIPLSFEEGPYRFSASARSNNNETLYAGSVVQFVDGSSPVVLPLDAVHGVFLAGPVAVPAAAPIRIRNVGIFPVIWSIHCTSARVSCQNFYPQTTSGRLLPGQQDTLVIYDGFADDTLAVEFRTTVGTVTVQKAIAEAPQPSR